MFKALKTKIYNQPPGTRASLIVLKKPVPTHDPNVEGNISNDEAKIGGITPAILIRKGKCEVCA
jgi:hypothetical protein